MHLPLPPPPGEPSLGIIHFLHTQKKRTWQNASFAHSPCCTGCPFCAICPCCPERLPAPQGEGIPIFLQRLRGMGVTKILRRLRGEVCIFYGHFSRKVSEQPLMLKIKSKYILNIKQLWCIWEALFGVFLRTKVKISPTYAPCASSYTCFFLLEKHILNNFHVY